jgi:cardiolipin synthase
VLVVDHTTAFTGGVGVAEEWTGDARDPSEWRDTHFRIRGPAVSGIFAGFVDNWNEIRSEEPCALPRDYRQAERSRGEANVCTVASSPSSQWSPVATLYREVWTRAQSHVRLSTPYFVPDETTTRQILAALDRGVRVEIIIPGPYLDKRVCRVSSRPEMATLIERGAEIHAYQPTMFHPKVLIVDDEIAIFGTANFNHRSLGKDDELVAFADCPRLVATLNAHFDEDRQRSAPWRPARGWRRLLARLSSAILRPFREQFRVALAHANPQQ